MAGHALNQQQPAHQKRLQTTGKTLRKRQIAGLLPGLPSSNDEQVRPGPAASADLTRPEAEAESALMGINAWWVCSIRPSLSDRSC